MERTQSFERPEYFGVSEEERERAVEAAGLPQETTREELTEDYFRSWLAQKGAEYPRGKSEDELKGEFAESWANPEFRTSQYEARAGVTEKISTAHEKNVQTPEQTEPEAEPEKEDIENEPIETKAEPKAEPRAEVKASDEPEESEPKKDERPNKMLQRAMDISKELDIELPGGEQKPGAEWFEIKKEIANRLEIEDIKSFNISDFTNVPAKWISDLIRKNDGEFVKYDSKQQREWTNEIMEKLYLSQLPSDEEQEEIVEEESDESEEPEEKSDEQEIETSDHNIDQYIEKIESDLADGKQHKTSIKLPGNDLDLINAFKNKLKQKGFIYGDTRIEPNEKSTTIKGIQKIKPSK